MASNPAADIIDLRSVFKKLTTRWWWFLITCAIAGALGVAYLKTTPKYFKVQATVMMGEGSTKGFGGKKEDFLKGMSLTQSNDDLTDNISMMTSRSNMTKTLQRLEFGVSYFERKNFMTNERYDYPPFKVMLDSAAVVVTGISVHVKVDRAAGTYRITTEGENVRLYNTQTQEMMDEFIDEYKIDEVRKIGEPFSADHLNFKIDFPKDREYDKDSDYFFKINSLEAQYMNYSTRLVVEPPEEDGHLVKLSVTGAVPSKEVAFVNKLMETYIEWELNRQQQKGVRTIDFINKQIGTVSDSLHKAESELVGTRAGGGVAGTSEGAVDALLQEKSRLTDEQSRFRQRLTYCDGILQRMRSASDVRDFPPPTGFDEPALNSLIIELSRLTADIDAQTLQTGGKTNPTLIAMQRRRRNMLAQLEQTAQSIREQAEISYRELTGRIGQISYQLGQAPQVEQEITAATRKFNLSEGLFNYLMEKKAEAGIAIASEQIDKRILDEAHMEGGEAIGPNKKLVLGGAVLAGLLIPVLFILLRDLFNDTITDVDQLKRASSLPLLATIPSTKRKRVLPEEPKSMLAEAFRAVRINLQYLNADVARQVIGFTSSTSGEGKTFCAVNLASVIALSGKRVVVVDSDLRRPSIARTLELEDGVGLSTWLIGEAGLNDIVRKSDVPGMDVITAGPIPPNPSELAESPRMKELMSQLRERYDHIIVDSSPVGLVSEFVVLMGHLDVTLYVVRERRTRRSALRLINELAKNSQVGRVDLLLNDVKSDKSEGYGYYTK
ncbi:MAG TPA: polysaccharide biosynthesis tyrosine autokinase [Flavobacteriales bacterium]|nr:polysaccharide biosynthesis tyrosine autokinase [Flavobacteriales bacterium]